MTVDVAAEAEAFGREVQDLLDDVLPASDRVPPENRQVRVDISADGQRYEVKPSATGGRVTLCKDGKPIAAVVAVVHGERRRRCCCS